MIMSICQILFVDLLFSYVEFSDHYVDLSEKHHYNLKLNILFLYRVDASPLRVNLISDKST